MNEELERIKKVFNDKNEAKGVALEAVGAAKLDDQERFLANNPNVSREVWRSLSSTERDNLLNPWLVANGYSSYWDTWQTKGIEGDEGRLQAEFQELCDKYVADHPDEFSEQIRGMEIEQLVTALSTFRAAGFEREQWIIEVWLKHHFEPQQIGGPMKARLRFPNGPRAMGDDNASS